jgi:hypothetical protein
MKGVVLAWILSAMAQQLVKHRLEDNMKIGLSYSRCVRDIVDGVVDIDDVLVIIARTDFDPHNDAEWQGIWEGYHGRSMMSNPEWANYPAEDEDKFRSVSIELWESGKLHQPRKFGGWPKRRPEIWLEAVLPNSELEKNPAAKMAWGKFQTIAGLSSVKMDDKYQ